MNNRKVKEIIKFSFYKDLQNKWFIIFNVITLVSILILMNFTKISSLLHFGNEDDIFEIVVLDNSNLIYGNVSSKLLENEGFSVSRITENTYTADNIPDDFVIIEATPDEEEMIQFSVISKEGIQGSKYEKLLEAMSYARNMMFADRYGISEEELAVFQSDLKIDRVMLSVDAEDSNSKEYVKLLSSALTYLIATLIFSKLSNEIAQEKQSKSSEYILTTVSAKEYLFAKIFSNVAIVVIQGILLMMYYYIAMLLSSVFTIATTDISLSASVLSSALSMDMVIYILTVILYNILNIILLCIIQATLAAKTASTSEAGNTMSLVLFIMVIAYVVSSTVIDPYTKVNSLLAIASCLPLLSAFFIPALMVIGQCSIWQIALSLILLIVSIPFAFHFCAKFFKNGILDYTRLKKKRSASEDKEKKLEKYLVKRKMKELGFVVGLSILIYVGVQTIFSLIGSFTLGTLFENIYTETEISLIMQVLLQALSLGLASIFVLAYCNKHSLTVSRRTMTVSKSEKVKIVLIALFLVFALQIVLSILLYPSLGLDYDITDMFEVTSESSLLSKLMLVFTLAVTPALFEELFFRKAMINFTSQYGRKFALVFSALLFGIIHMNLSQGLFAFIMGLILGGIYLYTGDIKLTMLIHFLNNGFAALAMILPEIWMVIVSIILFAVLIAGFVFFIQAFVEKTSRAKILSLCKTKVSLKSLERYKYVFADYTFDISAILVVLMSILTEHLLR
ncbi:MAG: CPBP family intramembrane metalloprotease [Clostridia bacterium]|nr:CPBP family intramembrane metalloprotease [Clostridia bacterium]